MKVGDFLKVMGIITVMAVLYTHLQMEIYTLAYKGKIKEQMIEKLAEKNVMVSNDILRLKSSDNIGRELLVKDKEYFFASSKHVVEVESKDRNWLSPVASTITVPTSKVVKLAFSEGNKAAGK
jgi:hypothetical protein